MLSSIDLVREASDVPGSCFRTETPVPDTDGSENRTNDRVSLEIQIIGRGESRQNIQD